MKWYEKKKIFIRRAYNILLLFGIDLKKILALINIFRFFKDLYNFRKKKIIDNIYPCLEDYDGEVTDFKNQFFHADLLISQYIFKNNPVNHLDIGSRIDGLVAHIASFRSLDVIDIRNIDIYPHININIIKKDLLDTQNLDQKKYMSISSVGVIAHVGLGRYGDKIDSAGHEKAVKSICNLADEGCLIYIMTPVGKKKIEFNAHRIFNPQEIINLFYEHNCKLLEFNLVNDCGNLEVNSNLNKAKNLNFGGGIFVFKKLKNTQ
jgi:hypothetical protein